LLSRGSQIDLADEFGNTALHLAVLSKRLEVATMLLDKVANVHRVDVFGNTTRDLALRTKSQEMIALMDKHITMQEKGNSLERQGR